MIKSTNFGKKSLIKKKMDNSSTILSILAYTINFDCNALNIGLNQACQPGGPIEGIIISL